jgi:hypothetical protein
MIDHHAACNSDMYAWQRVTCDRCGRTYQCTPSDDFYCAYDSPDHCCESCLVQPFTDKPVVTCYIND